MALTRITKGVIKPNENYDTHNINSTGIVTAIGLDVNGNGDISGNLSVGGVLTYEDVTSIDSVGIITAQKDIHVGAGVSVVGVGTFGSLDISGDIDVDGHTNLDNVSIAGVTTFASSIHVADSIIHEEDANTKISFPANDEISFDTSGHDRIYIKSDGKIGMGTVTPAVDIHHFSDGLNGNSLRLENREGYVTIINDANGLYLDADTHYIRSKAGSTYATINSSGKLNVNYDLDVDGHTELDNVNITGFTTFATGTRFYHHTPRIEMQTNSTATIGFFNATTGTTNSDGMIMGFSSNSQVGFINVNEGGHGFILKTGGSGVGNERINISGLGTVSLRYGTSEEMVTARPNGAVELYHNGIKRLETSSVGVSIPQDLDVDGHTNLDNVNIAGIVTVTTSTQYHGYKLSNGSNIVGELVGLSGSNDTGALSLWHGGSKYVQLSAQGYSYIIGGNVGINTTTPTQKLVSYADSGYPFVANGPSNSIALNNAGVIVFGTKDVASYGYGSLDATEFQFKISGSPKVNIDTAGRLLVNRTAAYASSSERLSVNGMTSIQGSSTSAANLYLFNTDTTGSGTVQPYLFLHDGSGIRGGLGLQYSTSNFVLNAVNDFQFRTGASGVSGTEKIRITSAGKLLIGSNIHNTTIASGVGSQLQIEGNSYQTSSFTLINNSTSTDPAFINFGKSRAGSSGGTTIVQNGDRVGGIRWSVADGNDLHSRVAQIDVFVNGTPGSDDTPGQISIQTTPSGGNYPLDRLNIDSAGRVTLGAGTQSQFASSFNSGANQLLITSNGSTGLTIDSTSSTSGSIHFADGPTGSESYRGIIEYNHSEDDMKFGVEGYPVARLRKGNYSDVGGGMIIGSHSNDAGVAHSDSRTLILGHTTHSETGITLVNSTSGSGKIRFSDNTSPFNQGSIAYYHGSRTVGSVPTYADSLTFAPNQKDDQFVMNGNEAMRLSSNNGKMKMVDGFWTKAINTSYSTVFTIRTGYDNSSHHHRGYFYEIVVFGGDWGSHSANRTYFKGFINGHSGYGGHSVIEHSGTYGSNSGGGGHYGSSECQITVTWSSNGDSHIQMKLTTGSVTAEGYARFIGWIRDYDGFEIR